MTMWNDFELQQPVHHEADEGAPRIPSEPALSNPLPALPESTGSVGTAARRRRRWPWAIVAALVVVAAGGGGYLAAVPSRNHLRSERDGLQGQLDQATSDLSDARNAAVAARTTAGACQRLVTDATALVGDWDKLVKLWQDPANQNVAPGSAQDQALSIQIDTIMSSVTFDRGLVTGDTDACKTAAAPL